ncbi:c-type cytochrome [Silvibacterium acidisoli]|uniref:c-type cytochrome n=1 Tax=Acidobacteriaceae bacterium ZG23-2 TaxID=2883246 RepID=UPI00406D13D3
MKKTLSASSLLLSAFALVSALACAPSARAQAADAHLGAQAYAKHCAVCHGEQRQGNLPGFPPLLDINRQLKPEQITMLIRHGRGRMPAFPNLPEAEVSELLRFLATDPMSTPASASGASSNLADAGSHLFQRNCAFCHGRDAGGGETGPDLTRSKLALADVGGDKIGEVVRNGRPEKKMPAFNFNSEEIRSLAAFIHSQQKKASSRPGGRRGVDVSDLQTGNVEAGKAYFNGAGGCAKCHSPTGDLAGVASRYEGLQLERRMLYPEDTVSKVEVTLASGQKIAGTLAYRDEWVLGMRDTEGIYHSWPVRSIHFTVDSPVDAHVELFSKYTDDDIHNLMAYIQTLK